MIVIIKILQTLLALSILILIHELGHFIFAKIFGIRVDKFFLFFDAGGAKLFSTRQKWFLKMFPAAAGWETEYGIGWLPLGGYCKISGMIDESLDTEYLNSKSEVQPWEFRSKPAWQRLLVMSGGVIFNFILAIGIYTGILAKYGEKYISNEGKLIYANELAEEMGFRTGDHIISFDDYIPEDFHMLQADLARRTAQKARVLRDGDTVDIYIDRSRIGDVLNSPGMFELAVPFVINEVMEGSPNTEAGLLKGDRIIEIESESTPYVQDAFDILAGHKGGNVAVSILRNTDTLAMDLQVDTSARLGVYLVPTPVQSKDYTLISAIPAGFRKTFSTIGDYLLDLKLVATPSTGAYRSVGSFISIGQIFPAQWDWLTFLSIMALLSVMLGVMNLIPIPALDGGHIVFTIYEMITGRKPSDKVLYIMQLIGMVLLFGLLFLAFGNDITRIIR